MHHIPSVTIDCISNVRNKTNVEELLPLENHSLLNTSSHSVANSQTVVDLYVSTAILMLSAFPSRTFLYH